MALAASGAIGRALERLRSQGHIYPKDGAQWFAATQFGDEKDRVVVRENGVATVTIESKPFGKDRAAFEAVLQSALDEHKVELICLGGFMRLLSAGFVQRWYGKMLNIHPSLLPSFPGLEPQAQALRAGVKVSGATVHFVIPETDAGPIVMQGVVSVDDGDTPETLATRILIVEHLIYPEALKRLAAGRISLEGDLCKTTGSEAGNDVMISPAMR